MKTITETVTKRVFESSDVVVDTQYYAVGIRRWTGRATNGYQWVVTPSHPGLSDKTSLYSDAEMSAMLDEGLFEYVGTHEGLRIAAREAAE
jgi:hypothetical protein